MSRVYFYKRPTLIISYHELFSWPPHYLNVDYQFDQRSICQSNNTKFSYHKSRKSQFSIIYIYIHQVYITTTVNSGKSKSYSSVSKLLTIIIVVTMIIIIMASSNIMDLAEAMNSQHQLCNNATNFFIFLPAFTSWLSR